MKRVITTTDEYKPSFGCLKLGCQILVVLLAGVGLLAIGIVLLAAMTSPQPW
jgi:hypothetical protein